jgi:hypothetical protein
MAKPDFAGREILRPRLIWKHAKTSWRTSQRCQWLVASSDKNREPFSARPGDAA